MNLKNLLMLILAIIAIIIGISVAGYLSLDFILTQDKVMLVAGIINIVAGIWLGASTLKHWSDV